MRDTLALALLRAEFCRAYAAERARPKDKSGLPVAHAALSRLWRSLRAPRRGRAGAAPPSRA
jgi:hypothetical protein